MQKQVVLGCAGFLLVLFLAISAHASWWRVLGEDFAGNPSNRWSYAGVSNGLGQAMMRYDDVNQRVIAQWDQTNLFVGGGDPYVITNSILSTPLGRALTDRDTFRFGATLRITPGTIPDTLEFYQIATFGLYGDPSELVGADRLQSDNFLFPSNTNLVRDANNLIEFEYYINHHSFGYNPSIQGVLIADMPGNEIDSSTYFVTGTGTDTFFHETDMGSNDYLPEDTNLYVEVTYFGGATNAFARRVYTAIYTDAARTNFLTVNNVPMYYWTLPAPSNRFFSVNHVGFINYGGVNFTELFGGSTPDGAGAGSLDDVYVDVNVAEGAMADMRPTDGGIGLTWASVSGSTYAVLSAPDPLAANWATTTVTIANSDFQTVTNGLVAPRSVWRIQFEPSP